jgi:hypothetical protein
MYHNREENILKNSRHFECRVGAAWTNTLVETENDFRRRNWKLLALDLE